jgi:hypothetical protein
MSLEANIPFFFFVNLKNFYHVFLKKVGPKYLTIYNGSPEINIIKYYTIFKLMWAYIIIVTTSTYSRV